MTNSFGSEYFVRHFLLLFFLGSSLGYATARDDFPSHRSISGVYPHLAYWNEHGECGTGAVVPWADRLWVITYAPHFPQGSTDKLYEITGDLDIAAFEGSVGGTPANRMIHRETNQLIIGPYVIDAERNVRVLPPSKIYGRLTGNARHLFAPERKVYFATMEEGIYEVDLGTLEVTELFRDHQAGAAWGGTPGGEETDKPLMETPGYHGKGLYSGQGRLIYANNGEASEKARQRPDIPSGCLAEWDGRSKAWNVVRRNQFTDIRGPGGLFGNENADSDPVWAIGWDHKSLLLMLLDNGRWYTYRLPKASHTYDGAHGWNTEWPRIQDIGEGDMVMNMHGMFWRFPRTFCRQNSSGIRPRSTYLKVIGDYCRWGDRLVFGCDDTAKNEFLNKRRAKGILAGPGQSHSNLWFAEPDILGQLGPAIGRGSVWSKESVTANTPSDPFLIHGFNSQSLFLAHSSNQEVTFHVEIDRLGDNHWTTLTRIRVPENEANWHAFDQTEEAVWVRIVTDRKCEQVTAQFHLSNQDTRTRVNGAAFDGLAKPASKNFSGGIVYVRGNNAKTLCFAGEKVENGNLSIPACYELDELLQLRAVDSAEQLSKASSDYAVPEGIVTIEKSSILYVDDSGQRWRLPKGDAAFDTRGPLGEARVDREVVTERDLFNCHGTFYELPARNAGGFAKIRPICTHNLAIDDYCSYRGLLILTGVEADAPATNEHILKSEDGRVALWAGVVDDLWKMGKPVGSGGPWYHSTVTAGVPSDPYLMTGYDRKTLKLHNHSSHDSSVTLQVDIDGQGTWIDYKSYHVPAGQSLSSTLPRAFSAYWARTVSERDMTVTATFIYE